MAIDHLIMHCLPYTVSRSSVILLQANKMVLCTAPFRLSSVIEAAMEIAGPGAAMKRLQVRQQHYS